MRRRGRPAPRSPRRRPDSAADRSGRPAGRRLRRDSWPSILARMPRHGQERRMASAPPTIFSPARRIAARRRIGRLQRGSDPARFVIDDMVEDMLERLAFLRHEPRRALVIGDWTGELAYALEGQRAEVTEAEPGEGFDEERPFPFGGFDFVA